MKKYQIFKWNNEYYFCEESFLKSYAELIKDRIQVFDHKIGSEMVNWKLRNPFDLERPLTLYIDDKSNPSKHTDAELLLPNFDKKDQLFINEHNIEVDQILDEDGRYL